MRLRDRLVGLSAPRALESSEAADPERSQRIARLRSLIGEVEDRMRPEPVPSAPRTGCTPAPLPFAALRDTPVGTLHVVERQLEPQHQHGQVVVRDALRAVPALLGQLARDPAFESVDLSRMLILDTETTGLAGGAGTVPFLIGLAWFHNGALEIEQLFLREFGAEAPLLHCVAERLRSASCLVTYNGKSFDWPLLRARFVLNRVPLPEPPLHLDLLHCARRVWKPRMQSVRLTEVERAQLGFYREDDIDGALIPGLYLAYLRGADPRTLLPVFTHNEHDMVALAAILWRLCAHFEQVRLKDDARDHLAYARIAQRAGDIDRAQAFAEAAAQGAEPGELCSLAHGVCASLARRRGDMHAAVLCWERALAACVSDAGAARVHLALTRLYERQLRDLPRAQHHARLTLACEGVDAHVRRLERLRRRLERMAPAREAS